MIGSGGVYCSIASSTWFTDWEFKMQTCDTRSMICMFNVLKDAGRRVEIRVLGWGCSVSGAHTRDKVWALGFAGLKTELGFLGLGFGVGIAPVQHDVQP